MRSTPQETVTPSAESTASPQAGRYVNLRFWLGLVLLNGLLFMPSFVLHRPRATFWPTADIPSGGWLTPAFVWRANLDPFRLHLELIVLVTLWLLVSFLRRGRIATLFRSMSVLVYLLALVYALYEAAMRTLFQEAPVFYSQVPLITEGLAFSLVSLDIPIWLLLVATCLVIASLVGLSRLLLAVVGPLGSATGLGTRFLVCVLCAWAMMSTLTLQQQAASPKTVVNSLGAKLVVNVQDSAELRSKIQAFDPTEPHSVYDFSEHDLLRRPNIYLIFVESYGSVLYQRDDWQASYADLSQRLANQLARSGWFSASTLSEAPTWGGGSWMSYTSALFGLRIDTQPQYLALFDQYANEPYPGFGHYLQTQGYTYTRLSSIVSTVPNVDWDAQQHFHGADRVMRFEDLDYEGLTYGWGPSPPDQYALHFARENVVTATEPHLFFFITQNSHYPWAPLPEIVDDWETFNTGELSQVRTVPDATTLPHDSIRQNYFRSIDYTLSVLTDLIVSTDEEDALFVLIGDHQPQQVSRNSDGLATPLHIISRDAGVFSALVEHGFETGFLLEEPEATMRHEGLYSLLMNVLLGQYGSGVKAPPPFLPNGVVP